MDYLSFKKASQNLEKDSLERAAEMQKIKEALCNLFMVPPDQRSVINILPSDDPIEGMKGYVIWKRENNEEISADIQIRISNRTTTIRYNNKKDFESALTEAYNSGKTLYISDDPLNRMLGFIVESRDSRVWHHMSLHDYKK